MSRSEWMTAGRTQAGGQWGLGKHWVIGSEAGNCSNKAEARNKGETKGRQPEATGQLCHKPSKRLKGRATREKHKFSGRQRRLEMRQGRNLANAD